MTAFGRALWVSGAVALCCACSGESDSENESGGDGNHTGGTSGSSSGGTGGTSGSSSGAGTITDDWRAYCVATFTADYDVMDPFGDLLFTARAGEEYLVMEYPNPFSASSNSASLAYLTPNGPMDFDVEGPASTPGTPFSTDCPANGAREYYAIFTDVSVYAEDTLTTKLCDLEAGTTVPLQGGIATGFGLASISSEGAVYEIFLNALSAQCGGAENGFVLVPQVRVLSTTTYLVPIRPIMGPP